MTDQTFDLGGAALDAFANHPAPGPTLGPALSRASAEHRDPQRRSRASIPPHMRTGVLLVEDDPGLQWRLARGLTQRGYQVVGTSSAEAALELLEEWSADLVVVDDSLPQMSGRELARRIQRSHPAMRVVLMSSTTPFAGGHATPTTVVRKPECPEALARTVVDLVWEAATP